MNSFVMKQLKHIWNMNMGKFGPALLATVTGGVVIGRLLRDDSIDARLKQLQKDFAHSNERHHNQLLRKAEEPKFINLNKKWEDKTFAMSKNPIETIFTPTSKGTFEKLSSHLKEENMKNAEELLNYYLKYPCGDIVELNHNGEGYAILGEDLEYIETINYLLCYVVGTRSFTSHPGNYSISLGHLTNYKNLCSYLENNSKTAITEGKYHPDFESKILELSDLYQMCMTCVGDNGDGAQNLCVERFRPK